MSRELTDTEARDHYRDELNRTRKALKDMAADLELMRDVHWMVAHVVDELYRILGERP